MIHFADVPVYLHRDYVDFRKQINGLSQIVQDNMGMDVFAPSLFVFCNKCRDKLKVLYWDQTGFCLWQKRLEQDKFIWPKKEINDIVHWDTEQLDWLLRGFNVAQLKPHKTLNYNVI